MALFSGYAAHPMRTTCATTLCNSSGRVITARRIACRHNSSCSNSANLLAPRQPSVFRTYPRRSMKLGCPGAAMCALQHMPARHFSTRSTQAVCRMLYGADTVPLYGSWDNAFNERALYTRQLYCKALVYASGGGRLARDWIAGSTALTTSNASLLHIALQHNGTKEDVRQLREHLLSIVLARRDSSDSLTLNELDPSLVPELSTAHAARAATDETNGVTQSEATRAENADGDAVSRHISLPPSLDDYTDEDILKLENLLLLQAPETRTFLMDTMSASLFHAHNHANIVREGKRRVYHIAMEIFGAPKSLLDTMWNVALQEMNLKKDKLRILGAPWTD